MITFDENFLHVSGDCAYFLLLGLGDAEPFGWLYVPFVVSFGGIGVIFGWTEFTQAVGCFELDGWQSE